MTPNETFGALVRAARKKRNMSQDNLGLLCDVTRTTIVNIEQGRGVSFPTAILLANILKLDLTSVVNASKSPASSEKHKQIVTRRISDLKRQIADLEASK